MVGKAVAKIIGAVNYYHMWPKEGKEAVERAVAKGMSGESRDDDACTGLGKRVVPRLRELAPRGQRESGGGIHATQGPLFCRAL